MAKIIVFGDIDISSLYISIDGCKEITVSGKHPVSFPLTVGSHEIFATTISKFERITKDIGAAGGSGILNAAATLMQDSTNTTISGVLEFTDDDVLLINVEQKGFKTNVYNKMLSAAEAAQYVNLNAAVAYGSKKSKKLKWLAWLLLIPFAILIVMFLRVFMARI
jgi:hypothetical protein